MRVVRTAEGGLRHGRTLEGRGAWLCAATTVACLDLATQRRMVVQIGLGMDDPRLQHPLGKVPPVDPKPLVDLLPKYPQARIVLLNFWRASRNNRALQIRLQSLPQISFDIATIETVAGIESLLLSLSSLRLLFGSYAPMYNFGSSWRKLRESVLTPAQLAAIQRGHAAKILVAG